MFTVSIFWYQDGKEHVHRFGINSVKFNGLFERNQRAQGAGTVFNPAMGDGDSMPDSRGAQALPCYQSAEEFVGVDRGNVLSNGVSKYF